MRYGERVPPPEDAPVAPPEVIGASLFLGLVAVVSISTHGSYLIAFVLGRQSFDVFALIGIMLSVAGFVGSLWLLALRRWAWLLCLSYAASESGLRLFFTVRLLTSGGGGRPDVLATMGQLLLGIVFLIVLAFIASSDTRDLLARREDYRRTRPG